MSIRASIAYLVLALAMKSPQERASTVSIVTRGSARPAATSSRSNTDSSPSESILRNASRRVVATKLRMVWRIGGVADVIMLLMPPQVRAISGELEKHGKNWYFMAASYAFGQDIVKAFQGELEAVGGKTVAVDESPLSAPDYTSYILKIRAAKPDVVVGGLAGSDISTFLKQWNEMGMRQRIPFAQIGVADADIWGIGPKAAAGIYSKIWYYF